MGMAIAVAMVIVDTMKMAMIAARSKSELSMITDD